MKIDLRQIEVVDDRVAEILRRKTPAERLEIMFGLEKLARRMMAASIREQHPDWSEGQIQRKVAQRWLHAENAG